MANAPTRYRYANRLFPKKEDTVEQVHYVSFLYLISILGSIYYFQSYYVTPDSKTLAVLVSIIHELRDFISCLLGTYIENIIKKIYAVS